MRVKIKGFNSTPASQCIQILLYSVVQYNRYFLGVYTSFNQHTMQEWVWTGEGRCGRGGGRGGGTVWGWKGTGGEKNKKRIIGKEIER